MKINNSIHMRAEKPHGDLRFIRRFIILAIMISFVAQAFIREEVAKADALSQVVVNINYLEEILTVTPGSGGSTKFYMSMDSKKTWELLEDTGVVDISTILSSKAVTLYFKGNKDLAVNEVKLSEEDKSLKAEYKVVSGAGLIAYSPIQIIEYKKGVNGTWKTTSSPIATAMYEIKGATLYIRTPATPSKRAGKVITVKIPKRPSAPSAKLDGSKFIISGLRPGITQYRVGDSKEWLTFNPADTKIKSLNLLTLLNPTGGVNTVIPAGRVEIRTASTEKKIASSVRVIEVSQQSVVPDSINMTGTTLRITDSNTKRAYEYTIVPRGTSLDLEKARWTTATSKNAVVIRKAEVGDKVLVRLKSYTDPTSRQIVLASTYKEFLVTEITAASR